MLICFGTSAGTKASFECCFCLSNALMVVLFVQLQLLNGLLYWGLVCCSCLLVALFGGALTFDKDFRTIFIFGDIVIALFYLQKMICVPKPYLRCAHFPIVARHYCLLLFYCCHGLKYSAGLILVFKLIH